MTLTTAAHGQASAERSRLRRYHQIYLILARAYPLRIVIFSAIALLVGVSTSFSLMTVLPVLQLAAGDAPAGVDGPSRLVARVLGGLGLPLDVAPLLLVMVVGFLVKGALETAAKTYISFTAAKVAKDYRTRVANGLLAADWPYFVSQPVGQHAHLVGPEAQRAARCFGATGQMYGDTIYVLVLLAGALYVSSLMTLCAVAMGLIVFLLLSQLIAITRHAAEQQTRTQRDMLIFLADALSALKPLRAMGRDRVIGQRLTDAAEVLRNAMRRVALSAAALQSLQEPAAAILVCALLAVVYYATDIDLPIMLTAIAFVYTMLSRLLVLQSRFQSVSELESAVWMLEDALAEAGAHREVLSGARPPDPSGTIRMVRVALARDDRVVLKDVTLEVERGRFVLIIGPSGAGKSTIVDLLLGFLQPSAGTITVGGAPLSDVDIASWRREIGYISQELMLLNESVRTNVTLNDATVPDSAVEAALQAAGALEFVRALPEQMDTNVGERGSRLSGGQRQRVMLARAMVHQPRLLILDEPTTAFDPETEAAFCRTLAALKGQVTMLAISHQDALANIADEVFRLEDGILRARKLETVER